MKYIISSLFSEINFLIETSGKSIRLRIPIFFNIVFFLLIVIITFISINFIFDRYHKKKFYSLLQSDKNKTFITINNLSNFHEELELFTLQSNSNPFNNDLAKVSNINDITKKINNHPNISNKDPYTLNTLKIINVNLKTSVEAIENASGFFSVAPIILPIKKNLRQMEYDKQSKCLRFKLLGSEPVVNTADGIVEKIDFNKKKRNFLYYNKS